MAIGLMSMGINPAFMLPAMLWHSRREQALLRLLPGMPQGQALNRAVARLQLRHTLTAWLLCSTGLVALALAADQMPLAQRFATRDIDRFAGVAWREGAGGAPVLDGVAAVFECANRSQYEEGDH
ncbi:MAG: flavin reductase, partial [Roseateles sp.]